MHSDVICPLLDYVVNVSVAKVIRKKDHLLYSNSTKLKLTLGS